jgi:hypothetical protein
LCQSNFLSKHVFRKIPRIFKKLIPIFVLFNILRRIYLLFSCAGTIFVQNTKSDAHTHAYIHAFAILDPKENKSLRYIFRGSCFIQKKKKKRNEKIIRSSRRVKTKRDRRRGKARAQINSQTLRAEENNLNNKAHKHS